MAITFDMTALVAVIVLLFSLAFWFTSKEEKCWYRRYLMPLMVASFALVLPTWWARLIR